MFFNRNKFTLLGVELEDTGGSLIELAYQQKRYHLHNYARVVASPQLGNSEGESKLEQRLAILAKLLSQAKPRTKRAVTVISFDKVMMRHLIMDSKLRPNHLYQVVKQQAAEDAQCKSENLAVDYFQYNKDQKIHINWVAAKREKIAELIQIFQSANLQLIAIDTDAFAIKRLTAWFVENYRSSKYYGFLYFASHYLILGMISENGVQFHKEAIVDHYIICQLEVAKIVEACAKFLMQELAVKSLFVMGNNIIQEVINILKLEFHYQIEIIDPLPLLLKTSENRLHDFAVSSGLIIRKEGW